jgi:hypothetical protein
MTRYWPCQLLFAACALAQSTTALENDQVKVITAYEKPRVRTSLHEHTVNRVMIYEVAGMQQFFDLHKKPYTISFKAGEVKWSPISGMHMAEVVSDNPVPIVEIEIKKPGNPSMFISSALDPVKVDAKHYKIEFENEQVRVLRVIIGPHESTPLHEHSVNRVVTYLTDQDFRVTSKDGKVEHTKHNVGEVSWAGPAVHKEENLSDKPFEVIVTELKN